MDYRIEILAREVCFEGFLKLVRYRLRHGLFRGGWSAPVVRERLEGLRAVAVLLYDPNRDQVVLVEQFRIGALEGGRGAWTLEPVGGVVEPGRDSARVVAQEAMEEAGCEIRALESIGTFLVSPGISDDRVGLFCGCVDAGSAGGVYGLQREGEDTRVVIVDLEQAIQELFAGRINTTTAIITIQWLVLNRDRLRSAWISRHYPGRDAGPGPKR